VFDHLGQEPWAWNDGDRELAGTMSDYWTNFVKTGDPNGNSDPLWPRFDQSGLVLHLDEPVTADGVANLRTLGVFDAVYGAVRGAPLPERKAKGETP